MFYLALQVNAYHRDGSMRFDGNKNDNYEPNTFGGPVQDERERLTFDIASAMKGVPYEILKPNLEYFKKCDPEYGAEDCS